MKMAQLDRDSWSALHSDDFGSTAQGSTFSGLPSESLFFTELADQTELAGQIGEQVQTDEYCYHNAASCPDCGAGMGRQGRCFACPGCGFGGCGM